MRAGWVAVAAVSAGLVVAVTAGPGAAETAARDTAADEVAGYLYRDLDNDGVQDAEEPPVPGVVIRSGNRSAITDTTGRYSFTGVTSQVNLRVDTGWFRSQCASSYSGPSSGAKHTAVCPDPGAGAGADQDFRVVNQLISATATPGSDVSLGLTPDWVGEGYEGFTTETGSAVPVDPAMRLSPGYRMPGAASDCLRFVCRPGETQWMLVQWLNQGTEPLTGMRAVVTAPKGSTITQVTPYLGHAPRDGQSVNGYRVTDAKTRTALTIGENGWLSSPSRKIRVSLRGTVTAGSEYLTAVAYRVDDDAVSSDGNGDGMADCSAETGQAYPGQTCELATDFSAGSSIAWGAIVRIKGAVDADAAPCPKVPKGCAALGVHDKTKPGDSNDAGAWKVDATISP